MRAVVLSIGSELLRGDIVDTNAAFLTRQLSQLGFQVRRVEQVGDDLDALRGAVESAMAIAEIVLCTGGLGPTQDDLTRHAIAAALDEPLQEDPDLVAEIEARFERMGRRMPARNLRQALMIPSAEAIPNPNGTAPGWYARKEERIVAAMPGPPGEMEPMWTDWVLPHLEALLPEKPAMRSLMTFGLGESAVEERLDEVIAWRPDVVVATYAKASGVEVHVTARAPSVEEAESLARQAETMIRDRLGDAIFGQAGATLTSVVGGALTERRLSLAVMESCTGGALASGITDNPGSSNYFLGGLVAYTAAAKARYGVDPQIMEAHGLVSPETARAMARAARRQFGADVGLGVTGVAGTEPVEGKPPGTVFIALHTDLDEETREIHRPGSRHGVKQFAAQCALDLLRRHLLRTASTTV
ncbi:MAG: competence/damage-inducible protein A [Chloroflexi bacterium]|nr:competence/damage-inducible protein A [Chloroflexota bacterium]